jgi:uncharacterized DUF497 family protein
VGGNRVQAIWNYEPDENVQHMEEHGLTVEDVEFVLENYESEAESRSSQRPCVFGYTPEGVYIIVIYDEIDEDTVYPVTAYEVAEP